MMGWWLTEMVLQTMTAKGMNIFRIPFMMYVFSRSSRRGGGGQWATVYHC